MTQTPASGPAGPVTVPARSSPSMAIAAPAVWNARVPLTTPAETASAAAIPTVSTFFGIVLSLSV